MSRLFPFAAVTGQETLKLALLLCAVNPKIGGVLIRGEKGTAKSTLVRGLAEVLPEIEMFPGCPFHCAPNGSRTCPVCGTQHTQPPVRVRRRVVTLPLNATEDRLIGGVNFNRAVREGQTVLQPGILAAAHRGILYVDEVNLLDDHLVDSILGAASSGENRVEREGLSFSHPSRFLLAGTMNPEEGALRPQLLDRFGLCVDVTAEQDPTVRMELMVQRETFDQHPEAFRNTWKPQTRELARAIEKAVALLPRVTLPTTLRRKVAEQARNAGVAGHRADLVMERATRAHAALMGREIATDEDLQTVAPLALSHRAREMAPPPPEPSPSDKSQNTADNQGEENASQSEPTSSKGSQPSGDTSPKNTPPTPERVKEDDTVFKTGTPFRVRAIETGKDRKARKGSGRRSRTRVEGNQGRYIKSCMNRGGRDIALDATLRAAAPYQRIRTAPQGQRLCIRPEDIREKIREKKTGNVLVFLVDASGSMGARARMTAAKGAVLSLLLDAYQKRDKVAMISFRRSGAIVNLPPTSSVELAARLLDDLPVGGRTPLSAGLSEAAAMVASVTRRDPGARPVIIMITDGKSNVSIGDAKPVDEALTFATRLAQDTRVKTIVVDTEQAGRFRFGLAQTLANAAGAECYRIDDLKADALVGLVKKRHPAT